MDKLTKDRRSENMRRIKSKGMKPELLIRSLVHSLGYRFRLHAADLPGKPDLTFLARKKVIFVNGCFWHQHTARKCPIKRLPKSNLDFWIPKLERTKKRDSENIKALKKLGWKTLTIWECQTTDSKFLVSTIKRFLR